MSPPAHEPPARRRFSAWRVGTPVVVLLSGALFAISAESSDGTDLRGGRYTDLASVVNAEKQETEELTARVNELTRDVEQLSAELGDRNVNRYQDEIETLVDPAGLTPESGEAVRVTLTDAPQDVIAESELDPNLLVVHQQDIQAVVNAMWRAGAEAVTVQGQRLVSTTGIKCEGNSVTLHGVPYSPPYVIVAVGDQDRIEQSLESDAYLDYYRADASAPEGGVGWEVDRDPAYVAPPYEGLVDIRYAKPMSQTAG
jgi:uncharacterized protein YlxW (UPF0749 family)